MGRLMRLILVLLVGPGIAPAARAGQVERWAGHIAEASARFGVPQAWIRRVMTAESGGRTMLNGRPIESHAGAMGLMQLMPGTWRSMRSAYGLGADPHDPRDNILAGTAYLRLMYDRFGHPGLFAAYNAGPGAYAAYLAGRRRLPAETIAYVAQVASGRGGAMAVARSGGSRASAPGAAAQGPRQAIFALRRAIAAPAPEGRPAPGEARASAWTGLFVPLRSGHP